jgi:ElaB/YqjD/DUF883 family membrane-anchored ribosome-binding protein
MATTTENITQALRRSASAHAPDVAKMRKNFDKGVRSARKSVNRGIRTADGYVHKNPWTSVGIAAGVVALTGIAIAALARRPRSNAVRTAMADGVEEFLRAASNRLKEIRR